MELQDIEKIKSNEENLEVDLDSEPENNKNVENAARIDNNLLDKKIIIIGVIGIAAVLTCVGIFIVKKIFKK